MRRRVVVGIVAATSVATVVSPQPPGSRLLADETRAVVHDSRGRVLRGGAVAQRTAVSVLDHGAIEPTIGVSGDSIFYVAFEDNYNVDVMRSDDQGRTWLRTSPTLPNGENAHRLSLDPYLHLDERTQRLFTVDLTVACSYLSFSDDGGESWTTNPLACGTPVNDHQTLFTGPAVSSSTPGYEGIVYYCFNGQAGSTCSKSLDGGVSFVPTGDLAFPNTAETEGGNGECVGLHGHGVVDAEGTIYLPKEHCGGPWLAISRDEGLTWQRVRVSDMPSGWNDPSVAVDGRGNVYYVWNAHDRMPYLVYSRDGGESWSDPIAVGRPGLREISFATMDAGKPGRVVIAYYGSENSRFPRQCGSDPEPCEADYTGVTWNGYMSKSTNVFARNPVFATTQINPPDRYLVYGRCGPRRCVGVTDFMDVEIAPDGSAWGAFVAAEEELWGDVEGYGGQALAARLTGGKPLR